MGRGLRFECQPGCTACCEQRGFVYLTEADVERAAAYLKMTPEAFEQKYVFRTRHMRRLRVPRDAQCSFLRENGCAIHEAKPTQCRIFPFWPELVDDRQKWKETTAYCPGLNTGPLIQIEIVKAQAEEMRQAYPGLYD